MSGQFKHHRLSVGVGMRIKTHCTSERPDVRAEIDFTPCEGFWWLNVFRCVEGDGGCLAG